MKNLIIDPKPIVPKHPVLRKHIDYYYFLDTHQDFESRYFAFPTTRTVLNIYQNADFKIDVIDYII